MRERLSQPFSLVFRIFTSMFPFLFLVIIVANFLGKYFWKTNLGIGVWLIYALLAFLSFKIVSFLFREKIIVEYDDQNVYVRDKQLDSEQAIPIKNLIRLNLRPMSFSTGSIRYQKYNLWYADEYGKEAKVSFYSGISFFKSANSLYNFVRLVKQQNSEFDFKNWTWSFDLKE